jgi:hypothetical protein
MDAQDDIVDKMHLGNKTGRKAFETRAKTTETRIASLFFLKSTRSLPRRLRDTFRAGNNQKVIFYEFK